MCVGNHENDVNTFSIEYEITCGYKVQHIM